MCICVSQIINYNMSTSRDFVLAFIEMYRENPCLWQIKDADYHNKNKRNAALLRLLNFLRTKDESANTDTVKKKIASLRNCFKKEFNKVKSSSRSGAGTDDVHVPKLWYYNEMLFLADVDKPRQASSVHSILDDMPFDEDSQVSEHYTDLQSPTSMDVPSLSSQTSGTALRKNKRPRSEADAFVEKLSTRMDAPPQQPVPNLAYSAYGQHIAEKLRAMPARMATCCQKIINDAIFMAEVNTLDVTSHIVSKNLLPQTPSTTFDEPDRSDAEDVSDIKVEVHEFM